ncbi:MAG: alpha-glucosidase/alpha-galactosidase [Christensenellaceae bacterium]|jgi:alpha-galactosidase
MIKITFMGAGSTVFAKNVLGDCMRTPALQDAEIALYDIDPLRLEESALIIRAMNETINQNRATILTYLGEENRKEALKEASFVVNAIQVGGYEPSTVIDFEIPKKYGLRQTIGDTLGIGGIMRGLRTIPVLEDFAADMMEVCPDALFLNYTNPMGILTGYLQRHTPIKSVGLCHSVQVCSGDLLQSLDMADKLPGRKEKLAGINHMCWLLELYDKDGVDLYPEIRRRAAHKNKTTKHSDMVRYSYIEQFGYYCTESSEHNAEYTPYFIKNAYPALIEDFQIPLDEYPRRCVNQIAAWTAQKETLLNGGAVAHDRSSEYASYIMEAVVTNMPYQFGGNVLNNGLIPNLPPEACVEVSCFADNMGIHGTYVGALPLQLAALNQTNINVQLLTIEAARSKKREAIYHAAFLDPHTAAELSLDDIRSMCDDLIEAHGPYMRMYQ